MDEDRRGVREKHYKPGSTIHLHCVVNDYLPHFKGVIWKHNAQILTQDSDRGGIRYVSLKKKLRKESVVVENCIENHWQELHLLEWRKAAW